MTQTRRLAAILAADVAGYSRLIGADEEGTLNRLKATRTNIIDPKIGEHRGRIVKTTGDGFLVEFSSVVGPLGCATQWQRSITERNAFDSTDSRIEFRIGVHQGDIVVEDGDIFGDGVKRRGSSRRFGRAWRHLRVRPRSRGRSWASRPHLRQHCFAGSGY
jgi:adenylate cyclase